MNKRLLLAQIAEELANKPLVGNENKCGSDLYPVLSYFSRDNMDIGFDWCAAFVYHCCFLAGIRLPIKYPDPVPCRFAGVLAWLEWSKLPNINFFHSNDDRSFTPQRGDLVIFDNIVGNGVHDHIGVVVKKKGDYIYTAEGNISNKSGTFKRSRYENVNGFIRISSTYSYEETVS